MYTTLKERVVYQNLDFKLFDNTVALPCGEQTTKLRIEHQNYTDSDKNASAVAVLALDENNNIILIENDLYAAKKAMTTVVSTTIQDETPDEAVRRALVDQLHLTSDDLTYCGRGYPMPGLLKMDVALYIAKSCTGLPQDFRENSDYGQLSIKVLSPVSAMQAINKNEFEDIATQLLIKHYLLEILKQSVCK